MTTQGFELFAKLGGDASGLQRALGAAQKDVGKTALGLKKLGSVAVAAFKILAAAAVAATAALSALVVSGLKNIDAQAKLARSMDATIDGLRGVQIAAGEAGVNSGQLGSSLQMLNSRLAEAARGTGTAVNALDRLGLSAHDLMRMDVDQRMATIADAMRAQGMSAGQASGALRELGVRSREMSLLMIQGGDAIRSARDRVDEMGLSISALDAAKIEVVNDQFGRVSDAVSGLRDQLTVRLAPALFVIAVLLEEIASEAVSAFDTAAESVKTNFQKISGFIEKLEGKAAGFVEGAASRFPILSAAVEKLGETFGGTATKIANAALIINPFTRNLLGLGLITEFSTDQMENFNGEIEKTPTLMQRMRDRIAEISQDFKDMTNAAVEAGRVIGPALEDAVVTATRVIKEDLSQTVDHISEFGKQAARNIQSSFADFLFDPFKDGLKGMLSGFVDMLRRMIAELMAKQLLLAFFGQFAGGGGFLGGIADGLIGKQKGGPVNRNTPYLVGERGPELMIPSASGTIIPNHKMGGGSQSTNVTVNINAEDPGAEGRIRTMIERDMAPQIVQAAVGKTFGLMQRPSFS